jgi:hypothetical protein
MRSMGLDQWKGRAKLKRELSKQRKNQTPVSFFTGGKGKGRGMICT